MKKVLIIIGTYLPGRKAGGSVTSIENLINALSNQIDFYVLTSNRDFGEDEPYDGIVNNTWLQVGNAKVKYIEPNSFSLKAINEIRKNFDSIYVCGFFNGYCFWLLLLKRLRILRKRMIVAPMGSLTYGACSLKKHRKMIWILIGRLFRLYEAVIWSVTSTYEENELSDILKVSKSNIYIASDIPRKIEIVNCDKRKEKGKANIIWISRISKKKNLLGTIDTLSGLVGDVQFDIYGPIEDEKYMDICRAKMKELPGNIHCIEHGMIGHESVIEAFKKAHIFVFETLSENYGHVIYEALACGCPCVISNTTPWRDLEDARVGKCIDIDDISGFTTAVQEYVNMGPLDYDEVSYRCLQYAKRHYIEKIGAGGYINLLG